jgi:peptide/nickel transport system permease protein
MSWLRWAAVRVARLVAALLISSFVIFSAASLAPGSPLAALSNGRTLPPEQQAQLRERFHLDDPFLLRYVKWLGNAVRGDFGISIASRDEVSRLISGRIWITGQLVLYASLLILVVGIGLGLLAGIRRGAADSSVLVVTALLAAVPAFVAATLLTILFVTELGWFPALGEGDGLGGRIEHLTLPAIALAMSSIAIVARVTRAAVRDEFGREHVQTAESRGIPRRQLIRRHVVRNAAVPITTVSGLTVASLFALSAIVERAFSLNGLGSYLVKAAGTKDIAVVQGISMVIVVAFVVVNLLVDVCYLILDPRIRTSGSAR